jgi:hypothetical protein
MRKLKRDDPCSRKINSWMWVLYILVERKEERKMERWVDAWFFVPITTTGDSIGLFSW